MNSLLNFKKYLGNGRHLFSTALLIIALIFSVTVFLFETQLNQSVMSSVEADLSGSAEQINNQIQQKLAKYRDNLRFLHATPPISGLPRAEANEGIDPQDKTTYEQWKHRLETIFIAFIQNNSEVEQLRVVSADERGMELIRVERSGGGVKVTHQAQLQSKSDRDYYFASTALSDGEIYMSSISLNREFGKIDFPYRPMLRLSLPIFDQQMSRFGFIIVNVNVNELLLSLNKTAASPSFLILTDSEGFFLIHPNSEVLFSRDLSPDKTWNNYYQVKKLPKSLLSSVALQSNAGHKAYSYNKKIMLSGDIENGFLLANLLTPESHVRQLAMERRKNVYAFLSIVSIILLIVLKVFDRSMRKSQELAEARAQSDAIVDGSNDAIIGLTKDGHITSWNRAARNLFCYEADFVHGQSIEHLSLFPNVDIRNRIDKLSKGEPQSAETTISDASHSIKYLALSMSPILEDNRQFKGAAIIIRDVTNERLADEKIRQANTELETKVAARTAELQKSSHVKSAFISNISHEMRTPLNGIIGTLNLIKKEPLSKRQLKYLDMTEVSVNSLAVLINDVLDLSKIEAGKLDLDIQSFNPSVLIERLCESMAVKANEKDLEFILDLVDVHCTRITSDPHRYSQILTNLINNAIKFTSKGYVKVTACTQVDADQKLVLHCSVSDTGIGIAEENQRKLFQAFSQEDSSVAAKYGGTGLGLSICKQLVELLNGNIVFQSEKEHGSTFTFSIALPVTETTTFTPVPKLIDQTAVILTPFSQVRENLGKILQANGCLVVDETSTQDWLSSGKDAPSNMPDLIFIDAQYRHINQIDNLCLSLLKAKYKIAKIVVLQRSAEPRRVFRNISPVFISKPIMLNHLLQKVSEQNWQEQNDLPGSLTQTEQLETISAEDIAKVAGARVLIVDDNEINIEVAIGVLSDLPLTFERAENGKVAIHKLIQSLQDNQPIQCVIMDCQMPILDGYQASNLIREGKAGEPYKLIPIIAVTASAMKGEKDKCLQAGMSDYVTKPISVTSLVAKVVKWTLSFDIEL
ncbi:ATP-binding protein [Aliiglaciecola sp. LCG003]|uniref:ATP-binding protein n=1 Tax=Aliiglaciecola sp. LCG003 TaxID=3053655 RepID=UPI0025736B16|nr:ATP-binding protein [Aliiglaciecola sp. LCG003]WJG10110.1 ATP-binding protein [Aliiglaciecola sp. LCG003]